VIEPPVRKIAIYERASEESGSIPLPDPAAGRVGK